MYSRMKRSSLKRGHPLPNFIKDEFVDWCIANGFDELYKKWFESGFKKDFAPSIDRVDNTKGYTFKNMQLTTWNINNSNGNKDRKYGRYKTQHKAVLQFDKELNFIAEYVSICEASRQTGIDDHSISLVCRGKRNTAGSYIWKYKK